MRRLSAPVILSTIVLTGRMAAAAAQDAGIEPPPSNPPQGDTNGASQDLAPGVIPQPTPGDPGVVLGVTLGELYTDNVKLAAPGTPRDDSWITVVGPFIKSAWASPRFYGTFDYTLNGYLYAGQAGHNQLGQELDTQATLAVLPGHLFIDGMARYGRQIINSALPSAQGTFFLNGNQANVAMATVSPYWTQDLGRVGTMLLRFTGGRVMYNRNGIPDEGQGALAGLSNVNIGGVQFSLTSPEYETWGWNAGYSEQRLYPNSGPSSDFARAQAGISRQVGPYARLMADVGRENKYLPDGSSSKLDAGFWDAGVQWTTNRDNFTVKVGHRFFGRSGELSWTHNAALLTTTVSYVEQPTDLNQQLLGLGIGTVIPPSNINLPSLTNRRVYLMKRASVSASYEMPKSRLTLLLYDESRRYFQLDNAREKVANASPSWLFNLGPNTTFTPTLGWQRYRYLTGQVNYTYYAQLALVHQYDPRNFGSIRLRNDSRNVYDEIPGAHGYRVNVIYVEWTHLFKD